MISSPASGLDSTLPLSEPGPSKVFSCLATESKRSNTAYYSTTSLLLFIVASLACIQGWRHFGSSRGYDADATLQQAANEGVFAPSDARFLGRNWRQRMLEQQVYDKDQEIKFLRSQLESAMAAAKLKDETVNASDSLIRTLQDRRDSEKHARSKAQLALAEKASALQSCVRQRETLMSEVERCASSLQVVTGGRRF